MSTGAVVEEVLAIGCHGETLPGIVTRQANADGSDLGAVIVVGGPQYRAGSHRQFVLWARAVASAGTPTLRFDVRGMGDATGAQRPFTELHDDIGAAIDAFVAAGPVRRVVLAGLCDGASAALLYLQQHPDPRVHGVVLLNPWVRSAESHARTAVRHYYLKRLVDRGFWGKLLRGQVAWSAFGEAAGQVRRLLAARRAVAPASAAPQRYQDRMAAALAAMPGPALVVLSGDDYTAREFSDHAAAHPVWQQAMGRSGVQRLDLPGADHTFSDTAHRQQLEAATVAWLSGSFKP